jgi:hypothetical protein
VELLRRGAGTGNDQPESDSPNDGSRRGTGQEHAPGRPRRAGAASGLDARAQVLRRLHLGRCALCERDRAPLLGKAVG